MESVFGHIISVKGYGTNILCLVGILGVNVNEQSFEHVMQAGLRLTAASHPAEA